MYMHLINWKWEVKFIKEQGVYKYKGQEIEYDAILPKSVHKNYLLIYPEVLTDLLNHRKKHYFKLHLHFNHMASSQAANVNLFLPILLHPNTNDILKKIRPGFSRLAKEELYNGFRIEFWGGKTTEETGLLGDHNARSGTDSDIAIAYYNNENELCLWLIEHKLTEKEFTTCGGYKSKDRDKSIHICEKSFLEILKNKHLCFYHGFKKNEYWNLTEANQSVFKNHGKYQSCPFRGGMNQLWRNQLLGLALENAGTYKRVHFSVVHHPGNTALKTTIGQYKDLTDYNPVFSVITSAEILNAADKFGDEILRKWINWYKQLYNIK
jgi:hypothetical protein